MWFTRVSINNPVFATMVMAALCVLGLFSYNQLRVERMPDVSIPVVFVSVAYPGASPEAIETELTRPIELGLNGIAGVKMIRSNSVEGRSETVVEFLLGADMSRAVQDVRDKVSALQPGFPRDAKAPYISRFDGDNAQPTVQLALIAPTRSARELSLLADQTVRKRIERVAGVARVDVGGMTTRQVRVDLDPQRLRAYQLTPADVSAALQKVNADVPVGLLSSAKEDALVRVEGRVRDAKAFGDLVIANRGNLVVRLGDLGELVEREREPDSLARVDGVPAIAFYVYKQQEANIVETGDGIKAATEEMRKSLPPGVELRLVYADSDWVKDSLKGVKRTLIEGALLTIAIVFLFLHSWRSTIITGLTLPIAVISAFIAIYAFGFTLNFMTMMALSLCIGLLIDDAIVVRENIVRHVHMGKSHLAAAREGTEEIGLAVMATTFAICAVFVPVAFMKGIVGKFFFPFGITVVTAVLVSLFVSFTLDPMLSSIWREPPTNRLLKMPVIGHLMRATDRLLDMMHGIYERLIHWVFGGRRHRMWFPPIPAWGHPFDAQGRRLMAEPRRLRFATITSRGLVVWAAIGSFVAAIGLSTVVGTEFIPDTDDSYIRMNVRMPVGTSLTRGSEKMRQVEDVVRAMPEVRMVSTSVGDTGNGSRNTGDLTIQLVKPHERKRTQKQVEEAIRKGLAPIPGADVALGQRPIFISLLGPDPAVLDSEVLKLQDKMAKIKGITDLETSVKPGLPAYAVRIRADAARELGLTPTQLAASLRSFVNGDVATYWTAPDGEQVEVELRLPQPMRENVAQLDNLPIAYAKDGTPIALSRVADVVPVVNPEVIKRQDLQRRQAVYAGVTGRPSGDVSAEVKKLVDSTVLPPGYRFDMGGQSRDQAEAFQGIVLALGAAVLFIYIVLASQFGSFLQPFAIMASLPLALIGVMLALLLTRSTLNLFSMIGLVMLMGLVTKNAILLVDYANHVRKTGLSVAEALLQAGLVRMRPIMMTTAAMIFGMLPMALALDDGGEIQAPMGRAIIGGVITSTLLTLIVVPVLYSYVDQLAAWAKRRFASSHDAPTAGGSMPAHMPASKE
ncbi:efflux RND transporter permease subunit [Rhizobacter sp. Root404]|uniref:efflux RND transporter permease subunit n=1 Tax=Rhizobacter sp. Root404 TaxID=1736528 RepID=UPI0006FA3D98|nr:efflux RND transporter permease subunit [Rhizobacter sp. Root404]KQW36302.1 nodulation protein NolG [Rhizobacter sp. Root404]